MRIFYAPAYDKNFRHRIKNVKGDMFCAEVLINPYV